MDATHGDVVYQVADKLTDRTESEQRKENEAKIVMISIIIKSVMATSGPKAAHLIIVIRDMTVMA